MIIECPSCHTNYEVGNSLPQEGRNVRCAACNNVWLAKPDADSLSTPIISNEISSDSSRDVSPPPNMSGDQSTIAPENDHAETAAGADIGGYSTDYETSEHYSASPDVSRDQYFDEVKTEHTSIPRRQDQTLDQTFEPPVTTGYTNGQHSIPPSTSNGHDLTPGRPDPTSIGNRIEQAIGDLGEDAEMDIPATRQTSYVRIMLWVTVLSAMLGATLFALTNPDRTARAFPSTVGLFDAIGIKTNSRGLVIKNVQYEHTTLDERPALKVFGNVRNVTNAQLKVPTVIVELRDKDDLILFTWATEVEIQSLPSGQTIPFSVTIPAPTNLVRKVKLRFSTRP